MALKLPPVHPYSIMLYQISKHLSGEKEKIIDLARIMGLRKFGIIDNVPDLFDRLEDEGCLSEFKVTDLGKALDIIDLPEAARQVREYEEKALENKSNQVIRPVTDDPPPYEQGEDTQEQPIPPTEPSTDEAHESQPSLDEEEAPENEINSTITAGELPIKEEGLIVEKIEDLLIPKDFNEASETLPCIAKMPTKYRHTVSGKSSRHGYPTLPNGIFSDQ